MIKNVVNTKSRSYGNVKVFTGDKFHAAPTSASYKNLIWENFETVTRNKKIATIPNWGPEYRLTVSIMVNSAGVGWQNILHFMSTKGDSFNIGDRIPAILYENGRLLIRNAVSDNGNYGTNYDIDLEKWYHIEIVQAKRNGKVRKHILHPVCSFDINV